MDMRCGGDDRIIRSSRAIEHPGRNLEPPSRIGAAQCAAENNIIRLGDRLVNEDWQTNHGCHRYKSLRKPVPWVLSSWVVQHVVRIRRSIIARRWRLGGKALTDAPMRLWT